MDADTTAADTTASGTPGAAALDVPAGLTARPLAVQDADAVTAVIAACELAEVGEVEIDLDDIVSDWRRPSLDFAAHTVGVFEGGFGRGRLVACGEVYRGGRAEGFVIPEYRGRGIGSALLRWTWKVGAAMGNASVGQSVPDAAEASVRLFRAHGYQLKWTSWALTIALPTEPAAPALPDGFRIRDLIPGRDDEAAYRVIEDAFNEWPDRSPIPFEDWLPTSIGRAGFEPSQLPLVVTGDGPDERVVGACLLLRYPSEGGWVQQIAVERSHRGRGLARALLQHAFRVTYERGDRSCGLSTDSRTGALGLYEHVGMSVRRSYTHFSKQL